MCKHCPYCAMCFSPKAYIAHFRRMVNGKMVLRFGDCTNTINQE